MQFCFENKIKFMKEDVDPESEAKEEKTRTLRI